MARIKKFLTPSYEKYEQISQSSSWLVEMRLKFYNYWQKNKNSQDNPIFIIFWGIYYKMQVPFEQYTIIRMTVGCNKMQSKLYVMLSYQIMFTENKEHQKTFLFFSKQSRGLETVNHHILLLVSDFNIGFSKEKMEIYVSYCLAFLMIILTFIFIFVSSVSATPVEF